MALTAAEQIFVDWVKRSLPGYFFNDPRNEEMVSGFAKMFESARSNGETYFDQTIIETATDLPPDFLDLHAFDRGTRRQDGETDVDLRQRLQNIPDALTLSAVLDSVQATLDAAGISGAPFILELRKDKGFFVVNLAETGTGGTFVLNSGLVEFEPDVAFARPPSLAEDVVISGAAIAANDGTFEVIGLNEAAVIYDNPSGAADVDATVSWTIERKDVFGNVISGFQDAYLSRGFRMSFGSPQPVKPSFIVILPFGCTASTSAAVKENLRQKKGAGIFVVVECRQVP